MNTYYINLFEKKNSEFLYMFYNEFVKNWNNQKLKYHEKKMISYEEFVKYCYNLK